MLFYWGFVKGYRISSIDSRSSWSVPSSPHLIKRPPFPPPKSHPRKFLSSHNSLHQIFPKTISPKIFPGNFTKNFPAHAMNARFAIFSKMPHHIFRLTPASKPHLMEPTLKTRSKKQPILHFPQSPAISYPSVH